MLTFVMFALAPLGYAGLAATAMAVAHGRMPIRFWRVVAAIITIHVMLIWHIRYDWQFAQATRNGVGGFLLFHAALGAIIASVFTRGRNRQMLILLSFGVVTLGAIGAVFMYDAVAAYRLPVILTALIGAAGLGTGYRRYLQRRAHAALVD